MRSREWNVYIDKQSAQEDPLHSIEYNVFKRTSFFQYNAVLSIGYIAFNGNIKFYKEYSFFNRILCVQ